jgi:glycogen operon protein
MGSKIGTGRPSPLGATCEADGVNFALFSANAERVELCLFDAAGLRETDRIALPERNDDVWHGFLPGAASGLLYGYRVHGPYDPPNGHRFNPNKLLIDPYARALDRSFEWSDFHCGYIVGDSRGDLSFDARDNAALIPKCRVLTAGVTNSSGAFRPADTSATFIYELHVRGYTMRHAAVPAALRGTIAGLGHGAVIDHLRALGVTSVELLPIHPLASSRAVWKNGLRDYWGYNSIAFFAVEPRYLAGNDSEFRNTVEALHEAGIEVILDVVFNHTGEGDEFGPTISFRGIDNASYYCLAEDKRRYLDVTGCRNTLNAEHPRVLQMIVDSLRYWSEDMQVDGFRFDLAATLARSAGRFSPDATIFKAITREPALAGKKLIAEPWDLGADGYQLGSYPRGWSEWNDKYRKTLRRFWRGDGGQLGDLATRLSGSSDVFARSGRSPTASLNYITSHDGFTLEDLVSYAVKHNQANGENNQDGDNDNFSSNYGVEGPSDDTTIGALRRRHKRNLIASLFLSQGIPMLVAGDEIGRTQKGNNNPYCQDNEISWVDWDLCEANKELLDFVRQLVRFRAENSVFHRTEFFRGISEDGGERDVVWLSPQGREMSTDDWNNTEARCLAVQFSGNLKDNDMSSGVDAWLLLLNASPHKEVFTIPSRGGLSWQTVIDTARDASVSAGGTIKAGNHTVEAKSLVLLSGCSS